VDVYIGKLPVNGSSIELEDLMAGIPLHSRYDRRTGYDDQDRDFDYFVIHTDSVEEGWDLIEQLNGRDYHGLRITAREYIRRSTSRVPAADWDREERRVSLSTFG
jgi:hypothetical protein